MTQEKNDPIFAPQKAREMTAVERSLGRFFTDQEKLDVIRGTKARPGRRIGKGKDQIVRANLVYTTSATSTAGGALAPVLSLQASLFQDWTQYSLIYDQIKVTGGTTYFRMAQPVAVLAIQDLAIAFDSSDGAALTTVADALTYSQHLGPFHHNSGMPSAPYVQNRSGFHKFTFKVPKGSCRNSSSAAIASDEWMDTVDAADIFGYVKFIQAAGSGTEVNAVYIYQVIHCLFRVRI